MAVIAARVAAETPGPPLRAAETVEIAQPWRAATSWIVTAALPMAPA